MVPAVDLVGKIKENIFKNMASNGITLTNNEIKYIIRIIMSLENRGVF